MWYAPVIIKSRQRPFVAGFITAQRITLILFLIVAACGTMHFSTVQWEDQGKVIGSIEMVRNDWGFEYRYLDMGKRLVRIENRDSERALLAGPSITTYSYDSQGRLKEEATYDRNEKLAVKSTGFAVGCYTYGTDDDGNRFVETSFLDGLRQPTRIKDGYAVIRTTYKGTSGKIKDVRFYDLSGEAALSKWGDVSGAVRVEYIYLQGIGEMVCAVFFDSSGGIVAKKVISGTSRTYYENTTTYYNNSYYRYK